MVINDLCLIVGRNEGPGGTTSSTETGRGRVLEAARGIVGRRRKREEETDVSKGNNQV